MQPKLSLDEIRAEALDRAKNGASMSNYAAILSGFIAKGIPASEIFPRENVFTFNAWKALGRSVKKGEHGVKITTFVNVDGDEGEESESYRIPKTVTVFHISQTAETTEQQKQWDANRQSRRTDYQRHNDKRRNGGMPARYFTGGRNRAEPIVRDPGEDSADRWTESNR
jgi:hypothetical protein